MKDAAANATVNGKNRIAKEIAATERHIQEMEKRGIRIIVPKPSGKLFRARVGGIGDGLLVHRFSEKARKEMKAKHDQEPKTSRREKRDAYQEFLDALYIGPKGEYVVKGSWFKEAMVTAARGIDGLKMTDLRYTFRIPTAWIPLEGAKPKKCKGLSCPGDVGCWPHMHVADVRVKNGSPDIRYRPLFDPWRCTVPVFFNERVTDEEQLVNLLATAGMWGGVGDWRAEKGSGANGCFEVL